MPDASPVKWHLAHTTWFFETFLLVPSAPNYRPFHPEFRSLFNSYYNAVGEKWPRPMRVLLSRPTVREVFAYRAYVDDQVAHLLEANRDSTLGEVLTLGLNHEQQHQELIVTDLKHAWSFNPLHPIYRAMTATEGRAAAAGWQTYPGGVFPIGHTGDGFAYDNESPRHDVLLAPFELSWRLVTNGEYQAFLADDGYARPELWLSDGWALRQSEDWDGPLYWRRNGDSWQGTTMAGVHPVDADEPVSHVSFYEADAFARWAGARLPSEAEWEVAAAGTPIAGHFAEAGRFHPSPTVAEDDHGPLAQLFGDVWQWMASAYLGYPGYRPSPGALGEYNGKFMCNQFVLRGASCATPRSHARRTYRNFFPPQTRWQFSGIRLARNLV